jgi:hypothetical protein
MAESETGTYVLWQRPELARRNMAAAWFAATGYAGGVSEEEAALSGEVILAGAPDFFPSKPLPAHVKVWRVSPRTGTDPDDLEGIMLLLFAGIARPVEEHDERAHVPGPAPEPAAVVEADQAGAVASEEVPAAPVAAVAGAAEEPAAQTPADGVVAAEPAPVVAGEAVAQGAGVVAPAQDAGAVAPAAGSDGAIVPVVNGFAV